MVFQPNITYCPPETQKDLQSPTRHGILPNMYVHACLKRLRRSATSMYVASNYRARKPGASPAAARSSVRELHTDRGCSWRVRAEFSQANGKLAKPSLTVKSASLGLIRATPLELIRHHSITHYGCEWTCVGAYEIGYTLHREKTDIHSSPLV